MPAWPLDLLPCSYRSAYISTALLHEDGRCSQFSRLAICSSSLRIESRCCFPWSLPGETTMIGMPSCSSFVPKISGEIELGRGYAPLDWLWMSTYRMAEWHALLFNFNDSTWIQVYHAAPGRTCCIMVWLAVQRCDMTPALATSRFHTPSLSPSFSLFL